MSTRIQIAGTAPLVVRAFHRDMVAPPKRDVPCALKEPERPEEEYEGARYRLEDGRDGFPAIAIKKALLDTYKAVSRAAPSRGRKKYAVLRSEVMVEPGVALLPIGFGDGQFYGTDHLPRMRTDTLRMPRNCVVIERHRPEYDPWILDFRVEHEGVLTQSELSTLLHFAGCMVGLGENRPGRGGPWGAFEVTRVQGREPEAVA